DVDGDLWNPVILVQDDLEPVRQGVLLERELRQIGVGGRSKQGGHGRDDPETWCQHARLFSTSRPQRPFALYGEVSRRYDVAAPIGVFRYLRKSLSLVRE